MGMLTITGTAEDFSKLIAEIQNRRIVSSSPEELELMREVLKIRQEYLPEFNAGAEKMPESEDTGNE